VRSLIAVAAALMVVPLAVSARPGSSSALTMKVSAYKVLYGHGVKVTGRLWGTNHAGRTVVIAARPYGASAPHRLLTVRTDAAGRWSFRAHPRIQTRYQARVGSTMGPAITMGVAPAVSVTALPSGRLSVKVHAAHHFRGRTVQLQTRSGSHWTTIARKPLNRAAMALFTPPQRNGTLRVAMSVNQAGVGYLGAASHALRYRPQSVMFRPSTLTVLFRHRVTFAGQVMNGHAGEKVTITAHRYGRPDAPFTTVTTGKGGSFSFAARPGILTAFRAHLRTGQTSPKILVDVRPMITVRELANGHVQTHVAAGKPLQGRMVQLQRLAGSHWKTVAKQPLSSVSTATFRAPLPRSVIRVAMSINQAGRGFMGAFSHPVFYHSV
jgi:hypothetical protein